MNKLSYVRVGDYLLPNLILHENPGDVQPIGKYGTMHQRFLREHKPALYAELILTEHLYPLLREVDEAAKSRHGKMSETAILSELVFESESH